MELNWTDVIVLLGGMTVMSTYIWTNQHKPRIRHNPAEAVESPLNLQTLLFYFTIYLPIFMHFAGVGHMPVVNLPLQGFGALVYLAGIGWLVWARVEQGEFWSRWGRAGQKQKFVHTGPYSLVRYPLYLGAVWIMSGLGLLWQSWLIPLGALILVLPASFWQVQRNDERQIKQFGRSYQDYMEKVPPIFPAPTNSSVSDE